MVGKFKGFFLKQMDGMRPPPLAGTQFANRVFSQEPLSTGLVFSRDRPMQLEALIHSFLNLVENPGHMKVLYFASNSEYESAYAELQGNFEGGDISFQRQKNSETFSNEFRTSIESVTTPKVYFLVDDIVTIGMFDLRAFASLADNDTIPSMRLGRNITFSYTHKARQPKPHFYRGPISGQIGMDGHTQTGATLIWWRWASGVIDWGYPYSLDGNIFETDRMRTMIGKCKFTGPNSLEAALMQKSHRTTPTWGVAYSQSRIVNIPANRVQNEFANFHGDFHQDELLRLWSEGYRMDIRRLTNTSVTSVHQELNVPLTKFIS